LAARLGVFERIAQARPSSKEVASRVEYALIATPDCLILAAKQAFTREVADG
jgi:hypothetical protein